MRLRGTFRSGVPARRWLADTVSRMALDSRLSIGLSERPMDLRRDFRMGPGLKNRDMTVALISGASLKIFSSYKGLRGIS